MPATVYKRLNLPSPESLASIILGLYDFGYSQAQVAEQLGSHTSLVENYFADFGLGGRLPGDLSRMRSGRNVSLTNKQFEVLDGLLLSDLHLEDGYQARASFGLKHLEFANSIRYALRELDFSTPRQDPIWNCWFSKSKKFWELKQLRGRWYAADGTKIVPTDLKLTPELVYWWYLGDGWAGQHCLGLATNSFQLEEIDFLREKLCEIGIKTTFYSSGAAEINTGYKIRIRSSSVFDFLDYIGPCRVECYKYKFTPQMKQINKRWYRFGKIGEKWEMLNE